MTLTTSTQSEPAGAGDQDVRDTTEDKEGRINKTT